MTHEQIRRDKTQTRNKAVIKHRVIPNLIWNLQRLSFPICLHKNMRGRSRIKYGMTFLYNGGFTLIELLVVVLIIGILAAIALPQYQKVVEKSRGMEIIASLQAENQAQQLYYMTHGDYAPKFSMLDVTNFPWKEKVPFLSLATDSRSNHPWTAEIEYYPGARFIYVVLFSGKYKGAGFFVSLNQTKVFPSNKILCMERVSGARFVFNPSLVAGSYCEKIFSGSLVFKDEYTRLYELNF